MDVEYRILNLFKTKQYDDCLKLCANALQYKDDRMIDFIRMRSMTIQAKVAGNGYDEVSYFPNQDELTATAVAKTPRPGTSFQQKTKTTTNPSEITKVIYVILTFIIFLKKNEVFNSFVFFFLFSSKFPVNP